MKTILQSLVLGCCVTAHAAQQIVVPNALDNAEGNSSVNDLLNAQSFRMQMVIEASQFSSLSSAPGMTNFLSSIWFRTDGASTDGALSDWGGSSVTLSITRRGVDGLSPIFAENVGANPVTIFTGALVLGGSHIPGADPQPFGLSVIAGVTPFAYSPAQGNLLVDIIAGSGMVFLPGALDAQSTIGDGISRVFAISELGLSGTADSLGLAMRFDFVVVPEPSSIALTTLGAVMMLLLVITRNRTKRHMGEESIFFDGSRAGKLAGLPSRSLLSSNANGFS